MTIRWTAEERQARADYRKKERERRAPKAERVEKLAGPAADMVEITRRPKMTDAQKRQSHQDHDRLCWICRDPVPMFGPEVQYDHKRERWEQGPDTLDNIGPAHTVPCHAQKSARKTAERAHCDRAGKKHRGEIKPKGTIQSAGFSGDYAPFPQTRGFARSSKDR
jgi:hypothetical protein